jgi:hypothetical protein
VTQSSTPDPIRQTTGPVSGASDGEPSVAADPQQSSTQFGATGWAKAVQHLRPSHVPEGAVNLNVEGRRLASPIQGFGKMWQKTYAIEVPAEVATPTELIATWKQHFPEFWPENNYFYGPLTGIAPGDVALLNMSMPGRLTLSTGVMVLYADDESFTLMTPEGHMFAGWITFSAASVGDKTRAQAQVLMRASDPIFELALTCGGHQQEDRFWHQTLAAVANHFGCDGAKVQTTVICVDAKRQWSRWRNLRHSSAIRSGMYAVTAPIRAAGRFTRRPEAEPHATAGTAERTTSDGSTDHE